MQQNASVLDLFTSQSILDKCRKSHSLQTYINCSSFRFDFIAYSIMSVILDDNSLSCSKDFTTPGITTRSTNPGAQRHTNLWSKRSRRTERNPTNSRFFSKDTIIKYLYKYRFLVFVVDTFAVVAQAAERGVDIFTRN